MYRSERVEGLEWKRRTNWNVEAALHTLPKLELESPVSALLFDGSNGPGTIGDGPGTIAKRAVKVRLKSQQSTQPTARLLHKCPSQCRQLQPQQQRLS